MISNEGDYLDFANEMREQYDHMKADYEKRLSQAHAEIAKLKEQLAPSYISGQFDSPRPSAATGHYSSWLSAGFYRCRTCWDIHPSGYRCTR
jgi:hypothetical protein